MATKERLQGLLEQIIGLIKEERINNSAGGLFFTTIQKNLLYTKIICSK